jgi:hypothetical protein
MCPLAKAGLGFRYLMTPAEVRLGYPLSKPCLMALSRIDWHGLHKD